MPSKLLSFSKIASVLALLASPLGAQTDCNCAETEVRFTAALGFKSDSVETLNGESAAYEVDGKMHQGSHLENMREGVAVTLTANAEAGFHISGCEDLVIVRFPHCSMEYLNDCLLYTSPSPRDQRGSRMPSSA